MTHMCSRLCTIRFSSVRCGILSDLPPTQTDSGRRWLRHSTIVEASLHVCLYDTLIWPHHHDFCGEHNWHEFWCQMFWRAAERIFAQFFPDQGIERNTLLSRRKLGRGSMHIYFQLVGKLNRICLVPWSHFRSEISTVRLPSSFRSPWRIPPRSKVSLSPRV